MAGQARDFWNYVWADKRGTYEDTSTLTHPKKKVR
jgi:hypothetical protein